MVTRRTCCKVIAGAAAAGIVPSPALGRSAEHEARFWHREGHRVVCELCPHGCRLSEGKTGICRNRQNSGGVLYALGYAKPCAVHIDPIEKKPFYHVLPGSRTYSLGVAGCNLRCKNCQNYTISQKSPLAIPYTPLLPDRAAGDAFDKKCKVVAFTYTEPSVWPEYVIATAAAAKDAGLRTALVSSGYINKKPFTECAKVLDFARFDLKSFSDATYRHLNAGRLQPVLETILLAKKAGLWVEIINLVIPGWNDTDEELRKLCAWVKESVGAATPLHFSRFFPLYRLANGVPTPVETLNRAVDIAMAEGLHFPYVGNVAGVGTTTVCPKCTSVLVDREGYKVTSIGIQRGACKKCGYTVPGVWSDV